MNEFYSIPYNFYLLEIKFRRVHSVVVLRTAYKWVILFIY